MKPRPSRSFEKAIMHIITILGEDRAAQAVSRSTSLIRKWSDPDNTAMPSITQSLALDRAFVLHQKEPAPIQSVYAHQLDRIYDAIGPETEPLVVAVLNLYVSMGEMTRTLSTALDDKSTKDTPLAKRIQDKLLGQIERITEDIHDLEKSVRTH